VAVEQELAPDRHERRPLRETHEFLERGFRHGRANLDGGGRSVKREDAMTGARASAVTIAIDTGGTFTDVVCLARGQLHVLKLPSTPADPADAVLAGIAAV